MLRSCLCPQVPQQVPGRRIRGRLERKLADERLQRPVHRRLADQILQQVHRERSLLVVDVLLVLDTLERQFLDQLAAARSQVSIELVLQDLRI